MKEFIVNFSVVIVVAAMVLAMAALLGYAVTAYREILFNVIKACIGQGGL